MALSCIIFEVKRDIGSKMAFCHTHLHSTPPLGGGCRNIAITFVLVVVQGRWKWRRSIDHYTTFCWSAIVNIALSCTVFELLTLNNMTLKSVVEVTQDHSNWYHRKLGCGFLFAFHSNYGSVLHHFRDKARYWLKIVIFHTTRAFDAPIRGGGGGFPSEYCHSVWYEKN